MEMEPAIRAVQAGDRDAFRFVIDACQLRMRLVVGAIMPDKQLVDDVVQQSLMTVYTKLHTYRMGSDAVAWAIGIARHTALNERKKYFRRQAGTSRYRQSIQHMLTPYIEENALEQDTVTSLHGCVDSLRGVGQELVRKYYFEGKSREELAEEYGQSRAWVRDKLYRARATLAGCLTKKGILIDVG